MNKHQCDLIWLYGHNFNKADVLKETRWVRRWPGLAVFFQRTRIGWCCTVEVTVAVDGCSVKVSAGAMSPFPAVALGQCLDAFPKAGGTIGACDFTELREIAED